MLAWEDRPFEIAYSLNPAFLAILLHQAIESFHNENKAGMPYALIFLIIPLVFYKPIRESLPDKDNKDLRQWLANNPQVAIHLHKTISELIPYIKEAITFAMQHEIIGIDKNGNFKENKGKLETKLLNWSSDSRTCDMKEQAEFLGKWFAKFNSSEIYRSLGIRI